MFNRKCMQTIIQASVLLVLVMQSLLLTACNSVAPAPAQTGPIAERDLKGIALQQSEVPAAFKNASEEDFAKAFPVAAAAHEKVAKSLVMVYQTDDQRRIYSNGIVVYEDEAQAQKAYKAIIDQTRSDTEVDIEAIGDETYGMWDVIQHEALISDINLAMIVWRFKESVLYVSLADSDEVPTKESMQKLAKLVQGRVNGK